MNYVQAIEFVELTLGTDKEMRTKYRFRRNFHGLHNNAILSRYPLSHPVLLRHQDDVEEWFNPDRKAEVRLGTRMTLFVQARVGRRRVWLVVTHLSGKGLEAIAAKINTLEPLPMIFVGDLHNTLPKVQNIMGKAGLDFGCNRRHLSKPTWNYRRDEHGVVRGYGHDHTHLFGVRGFDEVTDAEIMAPVAPTNPRKLLADSAFVSLRCRLDGGPQ